MEEIYGVFHSYIYGAKDMSGNIIGPDEHGYSVLRVRLEPGKYAICEPNKCATPVGLTVGTPLKLTGEFRETRKFTFPCEGEPSFIFTEAVQTMPRDAASAVEFVEGMRIRGIASANSKHIIAVTGPDIEAYFTKNPDAEDFKNKIPSLTLPAAEAFIRRVMTTTTQKHLLDIMNKHGAGYSEVFKMYREIVKTLGRECTIDEALDILRPHMTNAEGEVENGCYAYGAKADMTFDTIDAIAKDLGYRAYHPERLRALVYKAMQNISNSGHIWSSIEDVYNICRGLTAKSAFAGEYISKWAIYATIKTSPWWFVEENNGERIYLESSWFDERAIVSNLRRIQVSCGVLPYYDQIIDEVEAERNIRFSNAQRRCFEFLKESGVRIVTGGAGTGKTTTISGLLMAYTTLNPDKTVALCAPTGRAAQRMTELCREYGSKVKAYTIHKLLDFAPFNGETVPTFNESNPLSADMIIVDEMSMVDTHLFALLTKAVKSGALLILCGDANQLPSVGAGRVFWDMIDSKKFQFVRLTVNYRQGAGGNDIVENANKINTGDDNLIASSDFEIINCVSDEDARDKVIDLITQNPNQTVLSTIRGNKAGVRALNKALQPIVNTTPGSGVVYGDTIFKANDTVLMNSNNYDIGYVNGDIGTIVSVSNSRMIVRLGNEDKTIARSDFKDVSLAYAMTIHKSQGSEYDSVIVVLPPSAPHMMARNLLYTAVTRGKKHVTIIARSEDIKYAVGNVRNTERRTTLKELLNS